jgi:uncharacterized RDD family membrane protein YckC
MITNELVDYIRRKLKAGSSPEAIADRLRAHGWRQRDINRAFLTASQSLSAEAAPDRPAGFWLRVAASLIDQLFLTGFVFLVVMVLVGQGLGLSTTALAAAGGSMSAIPFVLFLLYYSFFESSSRQGTPGKRLLGMQVTDGRGRRLSFFRAFLRTIAKILSAVPLCIGYLMAAFTARKQALHDKVAATFVVRSTPVRIWRAVLVPAVALFIIIGGAGLYGYYALQSFFQIGSMELTATLDEFSSIKGRSPTTSRVEAVVAEPSAVSSLTAADYDRLLAARRLDLGGPGTANLGPAVIKRSSFWTHGKASPSVWLEVMVVPLPNLDLDSKFAQVKIDHVWNQKHEELYDPDNQFETEFFQRLSLGKRSHPALHLATIRNVYLLPGVQEEDIRRIEGQLILDLPVGLKSVVLDIADQGREVAAGNNGATIQLSGVKDGKVSLTYRGTIANFVTVQAFNGAGQQLESAGSSWYGDDQTLNLNHQFKGRPEQIHVLVADKMAERRFPFILEE